MKAFKSISLAIALLLFMNGCGLSLEVQKRVHRPGFYVNLSHDREHVRVNGETGDKTTKDDGNQESASLQKVKRSSYEDFEIEPSEPRLAKAPLIDVTDSNFSIAQIDNIDGGTGFSKKEEQKLLLFSPSLENLRSIPREAQASHVAGRGAPSMLFSFNLMDLFEFALLCALTYLLSYLFGIIFFPAAFFLGVGSGFLVAIVLVILVVVLIYAFVSNNSGGYY